MSWVGRSILIHFFIWYYDYQLSNVVASVLSKNRTFMCVWANIDFHFIFCVVRSQSNPHYNTLTLKDLM